MGILYENPWFLHIKTLEAAYSGKTYVRTWCIDKEMAESIQHQFWLCQQGESDRIEFKENTRVFKDYVLFKNLKGLVIESPPGDAFGVWAKGDITNIKLETLGDAYRAAVELGL